MKQGIFTEIDWEFIGANLANEDDNEQAKFFKSFIKELKSWETNYQMYHQLASIYNKLNDEERLILSSLTLND